MSEVEELMATLGLVKAKVSDHILNRPYPFDFDCIEEGARAPRHLGEPGEEHKVFWTVGDGCMAATVHVAEIEGFKDAMVFEAAMTGDAADIAIDVCLMYDLAIEKWMGDYGYEGTTWMTVWGQPRVWAVPLSAGRGQPHIKVEITYCLATSREPATV